ncbi:hypothetical protein [Variovorax sp. DXTD-1]|uniref:hypothetical protein n=1 Tax=Variovorax sp. DXTD-1 TaxID=2495592 RepID=UPI000F86D84B|nr:hypothetical protein [Variovorax sp. DXTD-1]RST51130.1 hypothetical protein EJI00_09430 [Variovorax sp. DXTD-1]
MMAWVCRIIWQLLTVCNPGRAGLVSRWRLQQLLFDSREAELSHCCAAAFRDAGDVASQVNAMA